MNALRLSVGLLEGYPLYGNILPGDSLYLHTVFCRLMCSIPENGIPMARSILPNARQPVSLPITWLYPEV